MMQQVKRLLPFFHFRSCIEVSKTYPKLLVPPVSQLYPLDSGKTSVNKGHPIEQVCRCDKSHTRSAKATRRRKLLEGVNRHNYLDNGRQVPKSPLSDRLNHIMSACVEEGYVLRINSFFLYPVGVFHDFCSQVFAKTSFSADWNVRQFISIRPFFSLASAFLITETRHKYL